MGIIIVRMEHNCMCQVNRTFHQLFKYLTMMSCVPEIPDGRHYHLLQTAQWSTTGL